MENKICIRCQINKPLNEFYSHKEMKDGHLNVCKDCVKNRVHKYRLNNIEKIREYDRNRPNRQERLLKNKEYRNLHKTDYNKCKNKWAKNNRIKTNAHTKLRRAILRGDIIKPKTCAICGSDTILQAHHYDYNKPLDVIFLCDKCHKNEHKKINEIKRKFNLNIATF